jgi:hypothetical protein
MVRSSQYLSIQKECTVMKMKFRLRISEGHFCGTDFWVEVKKMPACPYAVLSREMSKNGVLW